MSLGTDVKWLLAESSVAPALAAGRVYPSRLPEDPTLPALVYHRINSPPMYSHDGRGAVGEHTIQIDCYAASYTTAETLADQVVTATDSWGALLNGSAQVIAQHDGYVVDPQHRRQIVEVRAMYQEG